MFGYSPRVLQIAQAEGISEAELGQMIQQSAPYSREEGFNRRFHGWKFDKRGDCVTMMARTQDINGGVLDECPFCEGEGCKTCGWNGMVVVHPEIGNLSRSD